MSNSGCRKRKLHSGTAPAARKGYLDALAGRGVDPAYDTWREVDQRNYENGRLRGATIRAAGIRAPAWNTVNKLPWQVTEAFKAAHTRLPNPQFRSIPA